MLEGIEVIQTQSKAVADFYCEGGGAKFDLAVFLNQIARFVKRFYEAKKVSSIGIQFWIYGPRAAKRDLLMILGEISFFSFFDSLTCINSGKH